jgi:hypothetical protein
LRNLADAVAKLSGVRQVEARPATGSLIVTHDGSAKDLIEAAKLAGLFLVEAFAETYVPDFEAAASIGRLDQFLKETIGGGIDLLTIAAFAFFAMALRQAAAGRIMPPAATAVWYGLSLLLMKGAARGAEANVGDGAE